MTTATTIRVVASEKRTEDGGNCDPIACECCGKMTTKVDTLSTGHRVGPECSKSLVLFSNHSQYSASPKNELADFLRISKKQQNLLHSLGMM